MPKLNPLAESARRRRARALAAAAAVVALAACLASPAGAPAPAWAGQSRGDDVLRVNLLWTNDVHGHIAAEGARFMNPNFPPPLGGAASAAAYIKKVRREAEKNGEAVLLVDVGDMFQGTPVGKKTQGAAVIDYFNSIHYDLAVPGNHDFDLGREVTQKLAEQSQFPWLCANLIEKSTGQVVSWCRPTLMIQRAGLKIGFIGIITPSTAQMAFPENIADLAFLPMPETVAKYRDELRAQGADLIFLASHAGLPFDVETAWRKRNESTEADALQPQRSYGDAGGMDLDRLVAIVPGLDVAIGGHTHRGYAEPWVDPANHTICFESFGNGSSLGHAILKIDRRTKTLLGWEAPHDTGVLVTLFEDEIWPDKETQDVVRPGVERAEKELGKVVGRLSVNATRGDAGSNLVGNLVTDAMRDYFQADFAIQNLGGLRADIPSGDVTSREVFNVLPFENDLVVAKVPGALLRRIVERKVAGGGSGICISGGEITFNPGRPDGERVCKFLIGGQPLDPERKYRVAISSYLMAGNSGLDMLAAVPEADVEQTRITDAETLERYFEKYSPVRPRIDERWVEDRGCAPAP